MVRDNAFSELSTPRPWGTFIEPVSQFRAEKLLEREFPASHSNVIVDECLQLTTGIANGYGKKRVLIGDHRRAELYVERGFVLEYTPDLEFVAVNGVHLPAQ